MLGVATVDQVGGVRATDLSFTVSGARSLVSGSAIDCTEAVNLLAFPASHGANVLLIRDDYEDRWIGILAAYSTLCINPCWYY